MAVSLEETQFKIMTASPVRPLILKLAGPSLVSMLVTSLYNIADTWFVSQLGTSPSGAVGVVFSLMAIIQAVGFTLGLGSGSIIARVLGVRNQQKADQVASTAFFSAIGLGLLLTVAGTLFLAPVMESFGATPTVLPYAKAYARYILFGAPIMTASFVLNNILRSEGKARYAMVGLVSGGLLNMVLDPVFIFVLDLGISGAAIATLLCQVLSFSILLAAFLRGKTVAKLSVRAVARKGSVLGKIVLTGMPSFFRQGLASLSTILLNVAAAEFGDAALSAMSIVSKIFMLIFCVGLGVGQGYQPVLGYNYGAKLQSRVRQAFTFTYTLGTLLMTFFGVVVYVLSPALIPFFIADRAVISIGTIALRHQALMMPLLTTNVMCNMTFQSIGREWKATLLSCCRQGFFFIPSVLLLPTLAGLEGLTWVQPVSDFCTFLLSLPFAVGFYREVKGNKAR